MEAPLWLLIMLVLLSAASTALCILLYMRMRRRDAEHRAAEEKARELLARVDNLQLQNLESKLNPHLFKNILNSIQSHAYQTYFALDKLANVLDYILYESRSRFVSPKEEIAFALDLIEINRIKLSPLFQLTVRTKINEEEALYDQRLIAPLISVDLIENAFKHADLQSEGAFISVVFEFREHRFSITVSNKISPKTRLPRQKGGLGQHTLEERLRIIYKEHFKLDRFVEGDVHIAHLNIDLFGHKAALRAAR
ncbi:MAG: histidine kinase [Flavobacteriales bacterium]|nr:histidine kinase [Flavobacteriales bacterium]